MHVAPVGRGAIYSRIECDGLTCMYKVAFVPPSQQALASECGVAPAYLLVEGASPGALAAALRAIHFRWGAEHHAVSLGVLKGGTEAAR
jgi:hypothetical protein